MPRELIFLQGHESDNYTRELLMSKPRGLLEDLHSSKGINLIANHLTMTRVDFLRLDGGSELA